MKINFSLFQKKSLKVDLDSIVALLLMNRSTAMLSQGPQSSASESQLGNLTKQCYLTQPVLVAC